MKNLFLLFCVLLSFQVALAQKLSRTEKKIAAAVTRNAPEAISFLEEVVNINSGTLNLDGVRAVGDVFAEEFEGIGFATR